MRAFDRYALARASSRVVGIRGEDQVELAPDFAAALHLLHITELLNARRRGDHPAADRHRTRAAELAWALHQLNAWHRASGAWPRATGRAA